MQKVIFHQYLLSTVFSVINFARLSEDLKIPDLQNGNSHGNIQLPFRATGTQKEPNSIPKNF